MQEVRKVITEVGTNEWQVVVFFLGDQGFAINVDKTREILRWPGCRTIPESHPSMIGITSVRGEVLPLIDLRKHLGIPIGTDYEQSKVIIAEFNEIKLGFVVDAVERISPSLTTAAPTGTSPLRAAWRASSRAFVIKKASLLFI